MTFVVDASVALGWALEDEEHQLPAQALAQLLASEEVWNENSLWYRLVDQRKRLRHGKSLCRNGFVPCGGVCFSTILRVVVNYPG